MTDMIYDQKTGSAEIAGPVFFMHFIMK